MIFFRFVGLSLLILLSSCGLETVSTLPKPEVSYTDQEDDVLTFTHSASRYSDTDFQGYEIYYRIYPYSSTTTKNDQIASDIDTLDSGSVDTLMASPLSYVEPAISSSSSDDTASEVLTITSSSLSDGDVISLSFVDFLDRSSQTLPNYVHPELIITNQSTRYVYRNPAITSVQKFSSLSSDSTLRADMESVSSSKEYRILVFIAAYGTTSTLETVHSAPIAWGVIDEVQ